VSLWVDVGYATYGIEVEGGRCVAAPPIAHWMVGRSEREVVAWLNKKDAVVACLWSADSP
jgi:hypothetical protein